MDGSCLACTCVLERLDDSGATLRRQALKKVTLELGRNEFDDVVLRICHAEGVQGREYEKLTKTCYSFTMLLHSWSLHYTSIHSSQTVPKGRQSNHQASQSETTDHGVQLSL